MQYNINVKLMQILKGSRIIDFLLHQVSPDNTFQLIHVEKDGKELFLSYGHTLVDCNRNCSGPEGFTELTRKEFEDLKAQQFAFENQYFD